MSEAEFVAAVLRIYVDLPDTPLRPTATDQVTARRLFADGVPLTLVESALLLGTLRRLHRDATLPPLSKVRSLAYFRPVVEELLLQPLPEEYVDYLRLKLRRAASCPEKYVSS